MQHHSEPQSSHESDQSSAPKEAAPEGVSEAGREIARARSRLYSLLGQLFQSGLTAELLPVVHAIDEFAAHLPAEFNASEAAAAHQQLFGFALFAHESIFLDPSGMLGGSAAEEVMSHYAELGYATHSSTADGDQLGAELRLLAFLSGAEADAWEDGVEEQAIRMQAAQSRFMQEHLLRWMVPCLWAVRQEGNPFYSAVAELTWELISDHYALAAKTPPRPVSLPEAPDLLTDPKTSLRDIAEMLMTPCYSGLFISRTMVGDLGRSLQLPRGFTDRTTMLVNLMQSAAQYDGTLALLDQLTAKVEDARQWYTACKDSRAALDFALQPWIERTAATVRLLAEAREQAAQELQT